MPTETCDVGGVVISTMQVREFNRLEWFSNRGIIIYSIYTFRAFARSFALTSGTGYNTFLRVQHVL